MKKFITITAAVALTLGLGTATANAEDPAVSAEFTDTVPGKTTATVTVDGDHTVEIVKHNPRNGNEHVVRTFTAAGEHSKTVHFPKAKRWMQVYVYVDGVPLTWRMVEMPFDQRPVVKPRPWSSINTWPHNSVVWVHARQPVGTLATRRGTFYRVQVVRGDRVRTVERGRVDDQDSDRTRLRIRGHRKGPRIVTVRVKSRGKVIGHRKMHVRW